MRGSDHADRRLDEQREAETSGLTDGAPVMERDDSRLQEAPTPDERPSGAHRPGTDESSGDGPSIDEATRRADFARWFRPGAFPATICELQGEAWAARAPEHVVDMLAAADGATRVETVSALYDLVAGDGP